MLHFDPATHTYTHGGERIPSVTQILDMISDLDSIPSHILKHAAARGDAVHFACELHDRDDLAWETLEAELVPYVEAWIKFRQQTGFVPDKIEHRMFHPALRYAGTLDRTGTMGGKHVLIDLKAVVAVYPTTGPQLAAYEQLLKATEPDCPPLERFAVQLKKDGNYKLHPYADRADYSVFVSALTLWKWANRNRQRVHYEP
jgi:hypothetical protein